jgi:hypothetical protein
MSIQRSKFLLTFDLKHSGDNATTLTAYDRDFEPLQIQRKTHAHGEIVQVHTHMPNLIMLVLTGKELMPQQQRSTTLMNMWLAGIRINHDILCNLIEYKPDTTENPVNSWREYLELNSVQSTVWDYNGCIIVNLFDTNPFAWHLHVGNKIRF